LVKASRSCFSGSGFGAAVLAATHLARHEKKAAGADGRRVFVRRVKSLPAGGEDGTSAAHGPNAFGRRVVLPLLQKYLAAWPDVQVEAYR
jgi:hypothetical protein